MPHIQVSKHIDVQYIKLYISNKLNKDDFCFKKNDDHNSCNKIWFLPFLNKMSKMTT